MIKQLELRAEILDIIKKDPLLLATVALALDVSTYTMPRILLDNDPRLTQAGILKMLEAHPKIVGKELLQDAEVDA